MHPAPPPAISEFAYVPSMAARQASARSDRRTQIQHREQRSKASSQSPSEAGYSKTTSRLKMAPEKRASVDRTDQIPAGGLRSNGVLGSSQRTLRFSTISGCRQQKKSPSSVERESGPFFFWVQHWVQLGPVLGSFFGVKRCRINE